MIQRTTINYILRQFPDDLDYLPTENVKICTAKLSNECPTSV